MLHKLQGEAQNSAETPFAEFYLQVWLAPILILEDPALWCWVEKHTFLFSLVKQMILQLKANFKRGISESLMKKKKQ